MAPERVRSRQRRSKEPRELTSWNVQAREDLERFAGSIELSNQLIQAALEQAASKAVKHALDV